MNQVTHSLSSADIRNQQILLYQEMQIKIAFWYIVSIYFDFSWVFIDSYNNRGQNFDDVSKNDYPRLSSNKGLLK